MAYGIDYVFSGNIGCLNKTRTEFVTKETHPIPSSAHKGRAMGTRRARRVGC